MHIGETIVAIRKEKGMSQAELAQKMGVKPQTISQYERGIKNPKPSTIKKFADALGVDAAELYAANAEQREERALQTMGYTAAEIIAMQAAQKEISNITERYSPLEVKQIVSATDNLTSYLRTLRGEGAGKAYKETDLNTDRTLSFPAGSYASKVLEIAGAISRLPDMDAAAAQFHKMMQDFNKLNPAGREKALERVHELTEVPRYTSPAVTPAPASAAESAQAAPQSPAGDTDTHKEG